jgi:hypothetical protein
MVTAPIVQAMITTRTIIPARRAVRTRCSLVSSVMRVGLGRGGRSVNRRRGTDLCTWLSDGTARREVELHASEAGCIVISLNRQEMTKERGTGDDLFAAFNPESKKEQAVGGAPETPETPFFPTDDDTATTGAFASAHESTRIARVLGELSVDNRMELHLYLQRTLSSGSEAVMSVLDRVFSVREEDGDVVARDPEGRERLRSKDAAHMIIAMLDYRVGD